MFSLNAVIGKSIEINNEKVSFIDALLENQFFTLTFKVIWLPLTFKKMNEINKHLCCNIGAFVYIEEILDEDCLGTHKYNINIKCPVDCKIKFDQITVRQSIEGETLFIMAYGDLIRC